MIKKINVRKDQLALLSRNGDYYKVLHAGEHILPWLNTPEVLLITLDGSEVPDVLADYLRRFQPDWVERYCLVADMSETEAGALYMDGILLEILPPSTRRLYWRVEDDLTLVRMNTQQVQVQTEVMNAVLQPRRKGAVKGRDAILTVQVPAWHVGVLKIDGETQALLPPGLTAYWKINHLVEAEVVDTRLQVLEVSGQEILTKDKVNLRINLAANWRYSDVLLAFSQLTKPIDHLYRELQFALREAVGTRTLDELLEDKQVIDDVVSEQVKSRMLPFGMEIASLGVKDIVLPGDMKNILAQLVEAEKSAQANVIRRREETAATRSLLNTAKVMENNPVALRLKELETLERVAERIDNISVFGGLDQVLHGLVNIKG
ncbi:MULTISPECIES: slipin family protein [Escherichia]|jgi:regulator of protease activity HflC (stomatin/prohibitin superfamily)|uniref:Slipin family protein n=5 Tax=Escherichia coli TaxID=562 RepID=A0A1X0YK59_ECOLX|nr:slipin family protein [Escherichia coli]EFA4051982.1 slipin family protein [Escherichia coli O91:H28]ESA68608.1 SPFH/Band 7/PHB domain protein [Escherichia coli 113303]DAM59577.1 MAG TPA: High frequency of lysogenization C protein [Caudoviricetes sp.]APK24774.1 SPFH domain / Band 7 family protein [Escherichia coli]APK29601.1 SPFH domain / Band 7 family protein [Escherichia coli]